MEVSSVELKLKEDDYTVLLSDINQQLEDNCKEKEVINNAEDIINTLGNYGIDIKKEMI